jgi:hypothetical protein
MVDIWGPPGEEEGGEPERERQETRRTYTCPKCDETFDDPASFLGHLEEAHPPPTVERLSAMVEEQRRTIEELRSKLAEMESARSAEGGSGEVLMGEEAREARIRAAAAAQAAEALRSRGWSVDDLSKALSGLGNFLAGLGPTLQAFRVGPQRESPFEEAGKIMFRAFVETTTKGMAKVIGSKAAAEAVKPEEEEEDHG